MLLAKKAQNKKIINKNGIHDSKLSQNYAATEISFSVQLAMHILKQ